LECFVSHEDGGVGGNRFEEFEVVWAMPWERISKANALGWSTSKNKPDFHLRIKV